ncbi:hypothetical protein AM394_28050 [Klebsiella oxytoca]|nr:hypothetical protein AM394_28050 [Klebsiella oxytoca]
MTSLKTSIKTITYLSDIGCLEIHGASLETEEWWSLFEVPANIAAIPSKAAPAMTQPAILCPAPPVAMTSERSLISE